jgi:hypothetical protein
LISIAGHKLEIRKRGILEGDWFVLTSLSSLKYSPLFEKMLFARPPE